MVVLEAIEEDRDSSQVDCNKESALPDLLWNCHDILKDLQELKQHFDSVGTQAQRTWEREQWRADDLGDIRARLTTAVSSLNMMYSRSVKYVYEIETAIQ